MIDGRIAKGPTAYDPITFLKSLSAEPLGELAPGGLETISNGPSGPVSGPLMGGTLTQLLASFGTPFEFKPRDKHVLFLDEVNERPYRLHRMLTQLAQSGHLSHTVAIVIGQLPGCDEPGGAVKAIDAVRDALVTNAGFTSGPILVGFPSGHTTTPLISLPLGVRATVIPHRSAPKLILEEAAAA
jgi:muramoyltetrapeptide carboxypeptidase